MTDEESMNTPSRLRARIRAAVGELNYHIIQARAAEVRVVAAIRYNDDDRSLVQCFFPNGKGVE